MQADIDSAFRRIPIKPEHRPYSNIVFKCNHHTIIARHLSLMFGSVASVHHWERVGNTLYYFNKQSAKIGARNKHVQGDLIKAIARDMLKLPVLRFVDDYFAAESSETADHAMWVFARSGRACHISPEFM